MATLVTLVISLLAGAIIVTMTCSPTVAVIAVCGIVLTTAILSKAIGKL